MTRTARKVITTPNVNGEALQELIVQQRRRAEGDQFYTRAQVRLESALDEEASITKELKEVEDKVSKTRENLANLQKLLSQLEVNAADLHIELDAVQSTVHSLKQSGVTL